MELKQKVFLGGTCNKSNWRKTIISKLKLPYYDPVVKSWTDEVKKIEDYEKETCQYQVFVITPLQTGFFSIAEVIDECYKTGKRVFFCIKQIDNEKRFTKHQLKSLKEIGKLVELRGGIWVKRFDQLAITLNRLLL